MDYTISGIIHTETTRKFRDTFAANYYHNDLCNGNQSDANKVSKVIMKTMKSLMTGSYTSEHNY